MFIHYFLGLLLAIPQFSSEYESINILTNLRLRSKCKIFIQNDWVIVFSSFLKWVLSEQVPQSLLFWMFF